MPDEEPFSINWRKIGKKHWIPEQVISPAGLNDQFARLDDGTNEVLLYERDVEYVIDGKPERGDVLIWWSASYNEEMGEAPTGPGYGWSDDFECFVGYEVDTPQLQLDDDDRQNHRALTTNRDANPSAYFAARDPRSIVPQQRGRTQTTPPRERYAEVECYTCGRLQPRNEALADTIEELSFRSTGTGNKRFKAQSVFFCSERCQYNAQVRTIKDKPALEQLFFYGAEFFRRLKRE